jgi:hypothetical protein
MPRWKKFSVGVVVAMAAIFFVFVAWYCFHYSMEPAREFEVNRGDSPRAKVLIATQGSAFKDSIVAGVVVHLQPRPVYVKVIDVAGLGAVEDADWDAIVVIHTWQMREPQPDAQQFIARARNPHKVIVLSTSRSGTLKMDGIDAISSASETIDVPRRVAEIDARVDSLLDGELADDRSAAR